MVSGSVPWAINRPYFDLAEPASQFPLHAHHVLLTSSWLARRETARLGPNMGMTALFRHILVTEAGTPEYRATRLADLPPSLRSPAWSEAVELRRREDRLTDGERLALARVLIALTFYAEAVEVLRAGPAGDPAVDDTAGAVVATSLSAAFVAGAGSRERLVEQVAEASCVLPWGRAPAISVRLLQAALATHRSRAELDECYAPLHAEVDAAGGSLPDPDWRRLVARVRSAHARVLAFVDPAAAASRIREAEEILAVAGTDDDLLFREARRRLLDRRCLVAQRRGDLGEALAAATGAVRLDPTDSKAWLQLGNVHSTGGDHEDALRSYRRAAALGPLFTGMAHFLAGRTLDTLERRDEAMHEYLRAARFDPTSESVAVALGETARRLGDTVVADFAEGLRSRQVLRAAS